MKNTLALYIVLISIAQSLAQPDIEYRKIRAAHPNERAVIMKEQEDIFIDLVDGKPSVKQEKYIEYLYLDNRAGIFSEQSIDYSVLNRLTSISAATLTPKKSKYMETKVKDFVHEDKISKSVFYDGGKTVSFLFPSLDAGSKSWLRYTKEISEPRLLPAFFPQRGLPIKDLEMSLTASDDIELDWKIYNLSDTAYTFTKTKLKNNKTNYKWTFTDLPKYTVEEKAPGFTYYMPHIITWIKSYTVDGKTHKMLGTPSELYSWYAKLVKEVNTEHSTEIRNIVDSLVAGEQNELDKVKKIFYWVQDNVKYVAFEDGMGGFIPRNPEAVCHKRYGDCKDMASLIHNMLSYANITAHLTWIGSRRVPYKYDEISTPIVDDHMICSYIHDDKVYFLDATGQHIPFGWPTGFIQGKQALIGIDSVNYKIATVPIMPAELSYMKDSVTLKIENEKLIGKGFTKLAGYDKIDMTHRLTGLEKDHTKFFRDFYKKGNNKFIIDSYTLNNVNNKDELLEINYLFSISDYIKEHGKEIYVNLHLNKDLLKANLAKDRTLPLENEHNSTTAYKVVLEIPKGYKPSYIPKDLSFKDNRFGFEINYRQKDQFIILTEKFYTDKILIEKEDFDDWNKMIQEIKKAYSEVVILQKN